MICVNYIFARIESTEAIKKKTYLQSESQPKAAQMQQQGSRSTGPHPVLSTTSLLGHMVLTLVSLIKTKNDPSLCAKDFFFLCAVVLKEVLSIFLLLLVLYQSLK